MSLRIGPPASSLSNVEHLAWRSLSTLVLVGMADLERSFRRYGLVQVEYQVLVELYDALEGIRLGDLSAALHISPSRLSHRIDKLNRAGLVRSAPAGGDARGTVAVITHTGRALVDRLGAGHEADIRRVLFAPLQQQQVRALADALSTVAAALTQRDPAGAEGADPEEGETHPSPLPERRRWRDALRTRRP